jgi:hypothetical protein
MKDKRLFYSGKMIPYGHSSWFTATHEFVEFALKYFHYNPDYLRFLNTMWGPDEFAFNSLIMNSQFKENLADGNLRYIDWSEGKANPKTLLIDDLNDLMKSGKFLARKFDSQVDQQIIDEVLKVISK